MMIIYSKKTTETTQTIQKSEAFVAFITKNFLKAEEKKAECDIAEKLNKPMYAIVDPDIDWEKEYIRKYPWNGIYYKTEKTPEQIVHEIQVDLKLWYQDHPQGI